MLLMSHVIYIFIGKTILSQPGVPIEGLEGAAASPVEPTLMSAFNDPQALMFAGLAGMALVMSFVLPSFFTKLRAGSVSILAESQRLHIKFTAFVLGIALNEAVAVMGFAAGFVILKNSEFGLTLIIVSMIAMLSRFPTAELYGEKPTQMGVRIG